MPVPFLYMTEQQEIQLKTVMLKHFKNVNGFLNIDSNPDMTLGGYSQFDMLCEVIHKHYAKNTKSNF
jgi:hypothetical protein